MKYENTYVVFDVTKGPKVIIETLDTYGDENINITYAVDDLRDIESKTGDYSKVFD